MTSPFPPTAPPAIAANAVCLSYQQQALWLLTQMMPAHEQCTLNLCDELHFRGPLCIDAMTAAIRRLSRKHEVLRTRLTQDDAQVWQVPATEAVSPVVIDLRGAREAAHVAAVLTQSEAQHAMEIDAGALAIFTLLRLDEEETRLLMNVHHLIADGLSIHILRRDLAALYECALEGGLHDSPPIDAAPAYAAFVRDQMRRRDEGGFGEDERHWMTALHAELEALDVPPDYERPPRRSFRGESLTIQLEHDLVERSHKAARRSRAPISAWLLAAYASLLGRGTGQTRMIVGTSFVGRRLDERWREAVGLYANTVPLPFDLTPAATYADLVRHVSDTYMAAYDHQEYPIQLLIERRRPPRDIRRPVLFQVAFNYQTTPFERATWGEARETRFARVETPTSPCELVLHVTAGEPGMTARFEYCTDLFSRETITAMADRYVAVLEDALLP